LTDWQVDLKSGKLAVFMIDECHLLWGDLINYAWGPTNKRIEVPLKNQKEKQTYYGALDYSTKEFIIKEYATANSENTISFLNYLLSQRPGKRIAVIWDGATYHSSEEFRNYLDQVNHGLEPSDWQITCIKFAPNAPEQNPVEDIWLQTKTFIRKFYHLCKSFKVVKWLFDFFANGQIFEFPKAFEYTALPQPI
jgi:transposase